MAKGRACIFALSLALGGCASSRPQLLVLRPEPIPYADTLAVAEPHEQKEKRALRTLMVITPLQLSEAISAMEGEALNLTHYDDVVGSAWWEPRMGYRAISPEELALGPSLPDGPPATSGPLTVKAIKTEGVTPGFTIKDTNGHSYILKFDQPDLFHLQSAAGIIGNRLVWGAGYYVPEDYLLTFDIDQLVLDPKATVEVGDVERPLTMDDVRQILARTRPIEGTRYLALASKYVPGIPKGPFYFDGDRDDDPNDHFDHQHRRELRGLRVLTAWMNDNDIREGNTLDVYVKEGYLRHYLLDASSALGSGSSRAKSPKDGVERAVDLYRFIARMVTLGLYKNEDWEDIDGAADPAIGFLSGEDFDPGAWKANWANVAFTNMTAADGYWGAKIVAAFSDDHLRAAVATGGLPRPELSATLVRLLGMRRDLTVEYWFSRVSTVEDPSVLRQGEGSLQLSFRDLGIERGVWATGETIYDWRFDDAERHATGSGSVQAGSKPEQFLDVSWTGPRGGGGRSDAVATIEITTRRPGTTPRPATVFLRWEGQGYRVVGIAHGDPRK